MLRKFTGVFLQRFKFIPSQGFFMGKKKVLITGVNGFVGSHLAEHILDNNLGEVYGIVKSEDSDLGNIEHIKDRIKISFCDITDFEPLKKAVEEICPDYVFHLAAKSFVPESWEKPVETIDTNITGTLNLFEAVRGNGCDPIILFSGSSEEYGLVKEDELPINEGNELRPLSPYGVRKASADLLALQYFWSYGVRIIRARAFNHTGPRRDEVFVCSDWCKQIAEIEAGKREAVIKVGNLKAERDFSDVRDIVRAYWLAAEKCIPGEVYNIGSGKAIEMNGILQKLISMSGREMEVKLDESKMRAIDVPRIVANSSKFRKQTGWKPEINFDDTLKDLLDYWRERI
jgi:GDP-4-dehydro-6-deoxy-D-mannose reductase